MRSTTWVVYRVRSAGTIAETYSAPPSGAIPSRAPDCATSALTAPSVRAQKPSTVSVPHIILRMATSLQVRSTRYKPGLLLPGHDDQQFFQVCPRLLTVVRTTPDQIIHLWEPAVGREEPQDQGRARTEAKPDGILPKNAGRSALETDLSPDEEGGDELTRHGIVVSKRKDRRLARDELDDLSVRLLPLEAGLPSLPDGDLHLDLRCRLR